MNSTNDIFEGISLQRKQRADGQYEMLVKCLMDGIAMPVRKLSPEQTNFIGEEPYTDMQRIWAARLAFREDMRRNQRVRDLYIRQDNRGDYYVRCKIDGVQQLSSQLTRTEVDMFKRGLLTERQLTERHYRSILMDDRGRRLDESVTRNLTLGINQKKA